MCYIIVTHTLKCDVRPLISNGTQVFVEPFANPAKCECQHQPELDVTYKCDWHGCCALRIKMAWCLDAENCVDSQEIHQYVQSGHVHGMEPWKSIDSIEECLFPETGWPHACETTQFLAHKLVGLLRLGKEILQLRAAMSKMRRLMATILVARRKQRACHGNMAAIPIDELKHALSAARESLKGLSDMFQSERQSLQQEWQRYQDWISIIKVLGVDGRSMNDLTRKCLDNMVY